MVMGTQHSIRWLDAYAALASIDDPAWRQSAGAAWQLRLPAGARLFRDGERCRHYLLIATGSVQVRKTTGDGHEIVLYHVDAGQTCTLTTACMLGGACYVADAFAMTPVHAVLLSREQFDAALLGSPGFRRFVYDSLGKGIAALVSLIGTVAFVHVDSRLARQLIAQRDADGCVHATHQEIARELGTAREVVSRVLKHFEQRGWVKLHRGWIEITDLVALETVSNVPL